MLAGGNCRNTGNPATLRTPLKKYGQRGKAPPPWFDGGGGVTTEGRLGLCAWAEAARIDMITSSAVIFIAIYNITNRLSKSSAFCV
jgi:hypothetical protein